MNAETFMEPLEIAPGLTGVPAAQIDPAQLASFLQRNRDHLARFLPEVAGIATPEAAVTHLGTVAERVGRGELCEWQLFEDGVLCGAMRLKEVDPRNHKATVSYYLGDEVQGRGIATTAVRAVLEYGFDRLDLRRIELRCAVDNLRSRRLAERLGFVREAELRECEWRAGGFVNEYVYSLLRSEFRSTSSSHAKISS